MHDHMETVYAIAHGILLIGGALCVILGMVIGILMISILFSISAMARDVRKKYDLLQNYVMQPFRLLNKFLDDPQE